ncbi:Cytochrome c oxidase subunit 7B, mitochondrial, partial [Lemmus lemmus]
IFSLAKNTLRYLQVQHIQQALARQSLQEEKLYCYDKNGNVLLISGRNFFIIVGMHAATHIGIEKGVSAGSHLTSKKDS